MSSSQRVPPQPPRGVAALGGAGWPRGFAWLLPIALVGLLSGACGTPVDPGGKGDAASDAGPGGGADSGPGWDAGTPDAGTDAGPDSGIDAGTIDAGVDAGTIDAGVDAGPIDAGVDAGPIDAGSGVDGGTTPTTLRFFLLGDTGEGNQAQLDVATVMAGICATRGCDFAVLLGDNFYNTGVSGTDDPQWQTKFEQPYAGLSIPFYAVLGNHDYGGGGTGNEFWKGPVEVAYSQVSSKWIMPDTYYTFSYANVGFIALDTNSIMWGNTQNGDQGAWFQSALRDVAGSQWIIGLGHHPYKSNGKHGNAGTYEGIPFIPIVSGQAVKDFMDTYVCGAVDLYVCGHDHNRQWLNETLCGAELVVSGAGAKTTALVGRGNKTFFEDDKTEGVLFVEITGPSLHAEFLDRNGTVQFTRDLVK